MHRLHLVLELRRHCALVDDREVGRRKRACNASCCWDGRGRGEGERGQVVHKRCCTTARGKM